MLHLIKLETRILIIYQDDILEAMLTKLGNQVNIKETVFIGRFSVIFLMDELNN